MSVYYDTVPSPVGELLLTAEEAGLTRVYFEGHRHGRPLDPAWQRAAAANGPAREVLAAARAQLAAYFAGALTTFALPLAARGTPFQERVWAALRGIGFGETISYAELARRVGEPRAARAVGAANARNPLSVVVPCHRVIGADGSLTGFGGGVERKRWLLRHEGALLI
jgi:methylated-DNA-[protein]-cysteine S-methyltransferase